MIDIHASSKNEVYTPARIAYPITPHDTNEITMLPKAIRCGTGGIIVMRAVDSGADVTIVNVANGEWIDIRPQYIRATGTTCSDIIGVA